VSVLSNTEFNIVELRKHFVIDGDFVGYEVISDGLINNTFLLTFKKDGTESKYILQQINTAAFKNPEGLMSNIFGVTEYLRKMDGEKACRTTLRFHKTTDGNTFYRDDEGRCFRVYDYIDKAYTCQKIERPEQFYNAGKAFGEFQRKLADYPIDTLFETIPNFHNTANRFNNLKIAIAENKSGRADNVKEEIEFALQREADTRVLLDLVDEGKIPVRVTHNDTKLNNVLFDEETHEGICVIDLDTIMPGLSLYDFGDAIRFGANKAAEDEKDVSLVDIDFELYEAFTKGFLETAGKSLTETEIKYLPFAAKLMTFECGMRFLTDYIDGDVYFKTKYPEHNLVRTRTQFALVKAIEDNYDKLLEITLRG